MNIFDWRGPDFLEFYGVSLLLCVGLWGLIQWLMRGPGDVPMHCGAKLSPFEVGYLRGERSGAVEGAIVGLWMRGLLRVHQTQRTLDRAPIPIPTLEVAEQHVLEGVKTTPVEAKALVKRGMLLTKSVTRVLKNLW